MIPLHRYTELGLENDIDLIMDDLAEDLLEKQRMVAEQGTMPLRYAKHLGRTFNTIIQRYNKQQSSFRRYFPSPLDDIALKDAVD